MDAAVVFGHEAELVRFGVHLHRSFARHLEIPLGGSDLGPAETEFRGEGESGFTVFKRIDTYLNHVGVKSSAQHGRHQPDVVGIQVGLKGTKTHCAFMSLRFENKRRFKRASPQGRWPPERRQSLWSPCAR